MKIIINRSVGIILFLTFCLSVAMAQPGGPGADTHAQETPAKITLATPEVFVPMSLVGRKPVVEVKINGQGPFQFFLDTGAGGTVFNQDLADELKLPVKGTTKIGDPADPQGIDAKQNWVEKLDVGGATFAGFIAVSWDRSVLYQPGAPRGVLGMPLFKQLLLTIDYPQSRVGIAKGALPKADGAEVIEYQPNEGGLFGVPMTVAGTKMVATLDTGSPGQLSFPTEYQEKLPLDGKPVVVAHGRTVGGGADIYGAKLKGAVQLGSYRVEDPNVTFFDRLRHLNIGYGFIHDFAISIDQANRRMRFAYSAPTASAAVVSSPAAARPTAASEFAPYVGTYGVRRLTVQEGKLFLQRLSGPQGEGPKLELAQVRRDEFALRGSTEVRFKFVRDAAGTIAELKVLNQEGVWESAARNPL